MSPEHIHLLPQTHKAVITLCKNGRKLRQQCYTVLNVHAVIVLFQPPSLSYRLSTPAPRTTRL